MQIWHPCPSGTFQKGAIRMLVPENMGIDTKIISLSILEMKICWIDRNWTFFLKKNIENDFYQKIEKHSLFYSKVKPRFKIFYSYVYKKQSYIELIEMAHFSLKETVENDFFQKKWKNIIFLGVQQTKLYWIDRNGTFS